MNNVAAEAIKELLNHNKKGVPIEELENYLKEKKIKKSSIEIIYRSNTFKLFNGMVFLKKTLTKHKEDFIKEFEDYLEIKIINKKIKRDITNYYLYYIPELLFIEWIDISLDRKLLIFELLTNMIIKPNKQKDELKIFFNDLIEFYTLIVIYTALLSKHYEHHLEEFLKFIKTIEVYEEIIKSDLFGILTTPELVKKNLVNWKEKYFAVKDKLQNIFNESFIKAYRHSPIILKRVLKNEYKNFEILSLLSRLEYKTFYDWFTTILEEIEQPNNNLIEDLGL